METKTLVVSLLVTFLVFVLIWALNRWGNCSDREVGLIGAFATILASMVVVWFFTPDAYTLLDQSVKFELRTVTALDAQKRVIFRRPAVEQAILWNVTKSGEFGMMGAYLHAGNGAGKSTSAEWALCQIAKNNEHCKIPCKWVVGEASYCVPPNDLPDSMKDMYGKYLVWALNVRSSGAGRLANEVGYPALQVNEIVHNYRRLMREKYKVEPYKSVVYVHITIDVPNMSGVGALLDDIRTFCEMLGIRWLIEVSKKSIPQGIPGGVVFRSQVMVMPLMTDKETINYITTTKKDKKVDMTKKNDRLYVKAVAGRVGVALNEGKVLKEWNDLQKLLDQSVATNHTSELLHFYDKFFRTSDAWDGVSPRSIVSYAFPNGIPVVLRDYVTNNPGKYVFQSRFVKYVLDDVLKRALHDKFSPVAPVFNEAG